MSHCPGYISKECGKGLLGCHELFAFAVDTLTQTFLDVEFGDSFCVMGCRSCRSMRCNWSILVSIAVLYVLSCVPDD